MFKGIHHIAIICSDYQKSKHFYSEILGLQILQEVYREERDSYKLDLAINGNYCVELFSFPKAPSRPSYPEASGLRHLAFEVDDIEGTVKELNIKGVPTEAIKIDEHTGKKFTFFADPDNLPLELYQN
ncbi:VOC family protein [Cellulophaga sp. E16_2]|uniref:SMU1112c/YaeR family gloxylase I-like metalloprotein n=1 Tax=unclassified Cellulophaga TaxID=2634405 RepID=UPI0013FDEE19|nr:MULTISPECIES: VOC family protein [unclassified Cellulophaga]MBO0593418.1 VOC family protein [Cellulophaga sp. E16_2]